MPVRIGVAGYMGAGKTTCASLLSRVGGAVLDVDAAGKQLIRSDESLQELLLQAFGRDIMRNGIISFGTLGKRVFASRDSLDRLNHIVRRPLVERLRRDYSLMTVSPAIMDAALIPYWNIEEWFDALVWVAAPAEVRAPRVAAELALSEDDVRTRMAVQEELFPEPGGPKWETVSNAGTPSEFHDRLRATAVFGRATENPHDP